ncbi:cilia- and flagella-associated protein 157-like [Vanacampus margaritifer]
MPKKKERKGIEDKSTKKNPTRVSPAGDKENDLYLLQIRLLNEELDRQQVKCEHLEKEKTSLARRCLYAETEKKDAVEYLKMELLDKEDEAERLAERLDHSQQEARAERDVLRGLQAEELREIRDRVRRLEEDNAGLVARLAALETFEKQKEQLMSNMAAAEEKLADLEEEHTAAMHAAEMKSLLEKNRLEKELEAAAKAAVDAAAAEVERLVEQKLPEASRRAALENQEGRARYARLSEKAHQLARENHALRQHRGRMAADVAVLEETIDKMARRSCQRKKEAEQLQDDLAQRSRDLEQLRTQRDQCHAELKALRKSHATSCARLEAELQEERRRIDQMRDAIAALGPTLTPHMQKLLLLLEGPRDLPFSDPAPPAVEDPAKHRTGSGHAYRTTPKAKPVPSLSGTGSLFISLDHIC